VVSRSKSFVPIRCDLDLEALFDPSALEKEAVDCPRDWRFVPPFLCSIGLAQLKVAQNLYSIFPLLREVGLEDRSGVMTLLDLIDSPDIVRK
jgi:hypothetical protein